MDEQQAELLNETLRDVLTKAGVDLTGLDDLLGSLDTVRARVEAQAKNDPDDWQAHNLAIARTFLENYHGEE